MKKLNIQCLVPFFIFIAIFSCSEKKFETRGWSRKGDAGSPSPDREKMLDDLLSNYQLVGLNYSDLIKLAGDPDGSDSSSITYLIEIDYGFDIDPVYSKDLYFFISKDSVVTSYEIKEWKKD